MHDIRSANLAPGAACKALADYLESSLSLPKAEAANFLRYNYSSTVLPPESPPPAADIVSSHALGKRISD